MRLSVLRPALPAAGHGASELPVAEVSAQQRRHLLVELGKNLVARGFPPEAAPEDLAELGQRFVATALRNLAHVAHQIEEVLGLGRKLLFNRSGGIIKGQPPEHGDRECPQLLDWRHLGHGDVVSDALALRHGDASGQHDERPHPSAGANLSAHARDAELVGQPLDVSHLRIPAPPEVVAAAGRANPGGHRLRREAERSPRSLGGVESVEVGIQDDQRNRVASLEDDAVAGRRVLGNHEPTEQRRMTQRRVGEVVAPIPAAERRLAGPLPPVAQGEDPVARLGQRDGVAKGWRTHVWGKSLVRGRPTRGESP